MCRALYTTPIPPRPSSPRTSYPGIAGGLECQILDGVPCALARAVAMTAASHADEPVVALDLGYQAATFSLIPTLFSAESAPSSSSLICSIFSLFQGSCQACLLAIS